MVTVCRSLPDEGGAIRRRQQKKEMRRLRLMVKAIYFRRGKCCVPVLAHPTVRGLPGGQAEKQGGEGHGA